MELQKKQKRKVLAGQGRPGPPPFFETIFEFEMSRFVSPPSNRSIEGKGPPLLFLGIGVL
jgi:hypothetical protein